MHEQGISGSTFLRTPYAMPGTDLLCSGMRIGAGCAMPGTDLAHRTPLRLSSYRRATQCPVLT
eukprot:484219-Rhodomonas_salina.4